MIEGTVGIQVRSLKTVERRGNVVASRILRRGLVAALIDRLGLFVVRWEARKNSLSP